MQTIPDDRLFLIHITNQDTGHTVTIPVQGLKASLVKIGVRLEAMADAEYISIQQQQKSK